MNRFGKHPIKTIVLVILALVGVGVLSVFIYIKLMFDSVGHSSSNTRNEITMRYNQVQLPTELKYVSRQASGDGIDSSPGWDYFYKSNKPTEATLSDIKTGLEAQGYVSNVELGPGTLGMENHSTGLMLFFNFKADGAVIVNAGFNK